MTKKLKQTAFSAISLATIVSPITISCSSSSKENRVHLVTDSAPIEDKSFNEQARDAARDWANKNDTTWGATRSNSSSASDLRAAWQAAVDAGAKTLITTGFGSGASYQEFAKVHLKNNFIYIDGSATAPNLIALQFKVEQAAFLAGIASGIMLNLNSERFAEDGYKVGGWGGQDIQPIWAFIGGFQQGIAYFNKNIAKNKANMVEWVMPGSNRASMISGSWNLGDGRQIANKLIEKNVDLILPVAGAQTNDAIAAIKDASPSSKILIIGVDTNQTLALGQDGKFAFTSIMKNIKAATMQALDVFNGKTIEGIEKGQTAYEGLDKQFVKLSEGLIKRTERVLAGLQGNIEVAMTTAQAESIYKRNSLEQSMLSTEAKSIWDIVSNNNDFKAAALNSLDRMLSTFKGIEGATYEEFDLDAARSDTPSQTN